MSIFTYLQDKGQLHTVPSLIAFLLVAIVFYRLLLGQKSYTE